MQAEKLEHSTVRLNPPCFVDGFFDFKKSLLGQISVIHKWKSGKADCTEY